MEILGFFPQTGPFCSRIRWLRCLRTTYCCKLSQKASNSLAFGSVKEKSKWVKFLPNRPITIAFNITVVSSSCSTWSYSDMATQKMMAVTSSKQWIHFLRSDRWPPTSNNLKRKINKGYSYFLEIKTLAQFHEKF